MTSFSTSFYRLLAEKSAGTINSRPFAGTSTPLRIARSYIKSQILTWARAHRFYWIPKPDRAAAELEYITSNFERFQGLLDNLADVESKELLIETLVLRLLGPYYLRPRILDEGFEDRFRSYHPGAMLRSGSVRHAGFPICNYYELPWRGGLLRLNASPFGIMTIFASEQYAYRSKNLTVEASEGDVVVDGGGYLGETALYFSSSVGRSGKVLVFEFNEMAKRLMAENLAMNPQLAERISLVPFGIWSKSGESISYVNQGPGTSLARSRQSEEFNSANVEATTLAVDDLVEKNQLNRLDFIKLDVEGAERGALKGAEASIRRFHPKLAVSVYHQIEDFVVLYEYIKSLNIGYRFFLKHAADDESETVLFAKV